MMSFKKKINTWLQGNGFNQTIDHESVIRKIESKIQPVTLLDRSFAQYLAQVEVYQNKRKLYILFPILTSLCVFYIVFNFFRSLFYFKRDRYFRKRTSVASTLPNIKMAPFSIVDSYNIDDLNKGNKINLILKDVKLQAIIYIRYILHPYFAIKNIEAITKYSYIARLYKKALVSNEYSFTSSVITMYLNMNGVKVYNCMHGDKLFNVRDSFCKYDKFFVWDSHYINIMRSLRCEAYYIVDGCDFIKIKRKSGIVPDVITYFLQGGESKNQLLYIKRKLQKYVDIEDAKLIKVRPHPRYKTEFLHDVFLASEIDDLEFSYSFSRSRVVCGRYSTVLFQAFINKNSEGLPKVLVDTKHWNPPEGYIMLEKADYLF